MDMAVANRRAQRLGDARHHQQIAVGKAGQAGVEGSQHMGFNPKIPGERRTREIDVVGCQNQAVDRSEEHTSELQSLMRISYAVFCLKKKKCYRYATSCASHD